jgi:hypothetical protein
MQFGYQRIPYFYTIEKLQFHLILNWVNPWQTKWLESKLWGSFFKSFSWHNRNIYLKVKVNKKIYKQLVNY